MVKSMTGYGQAVELIDGKEISVEIKSVNHRYFEFSSRVSRGYAFLEDKLKSFLQKEISRGKIDVYISVRSIEDNATEVVVNKSLASGYIDALRALAEEYSITNDISVSTIAQYNDLFSIRKAKIDENEAWEMILSVLRPATDKFINMREIEGEKLKEDILSRTANILKIVNEIEKRSPETVREYSSRLRSKIEELLGDAKVDEQRLITEVAIFADKIAVDEETVRLKSHISQMNSMLEATEPIGRKLDFIVQEMNRETNTIGSKSQNTDIAHMVVDIKSEIEKIREQIQNIE